MCLGIAEDEIAEAHVHGQEVPQVDVHLLRVLVDVLDTDARLLCLFTVHLLRTLHDQGDILISLTDGLQQFEASFRVFLLPFMHRETAVADHAQGVISIFLIQLPGFLVVTCKHHLWTTAHSQGGRMGVQRLGSEPLTLCKDITI